MLAELVGAVDLGGTKTAIVVSPVGDVSPVATLRPMVAPTPPASEDAIDHIVDTLKALALAGSGRLRAVAVGAPGPLDPDSGTIIHSPNLGWRDVAIAAAVADRLDVPVSLEDDAKMGAYGEWVLGAERLPDPFVYLTVGSGVGGGVIVGGQVVSGRSGLAGEVGHLVVDPTGPRCACGRRGCVEAYAGGVALCRQARALRPTAADRLRPVDAVDALFALARAGDPVAQAIVDRAAYALGFAIAAIGAVLEPELIAVGGSVALGQPALIRAAGRIAAKRRLRETARTIQVRTSRLGDRAVLGGALLRAQDLIRPQPGRRSQRRSDWQC